MGWNYRKSINLGGGLRINISKSGIGISGGVKGLRLSHGPRGNRLTASIPGTGIYYSKKLSGRQGSRTTAHRQPTRNYSFTQEVTNAYTGETRTLQASTQWELNELIRIEEERQRINENRQRRLQEISEKEKKVNEMNRQMEAQRKEYLSIIDHTLSVNDRIDWEKELITDKYPEFNFYESMPVSSKPLKLPFVRSLFMNPAQFELDDRKEREAVIDYENRRASALAAYIKNKNDFEIAKNRKNGEIEYLKRKFEENDGSAIENYISIVLTRSSYPADFDRDFKVFYIKSEKLVIIDYLFQDIDQFPITERYLFTSNRAAIHEQLMDKDKAQDFYCRVLYSVGVRTIHEVFESVYTDSVDNVIFNGFIVNEAENQCAFAFRTTRQNFEAINLKGTLYEIVNKIENRSIRDFTGSESVTPFTA